MDKVVPSIKQWILNEENVFVTILLGSHVTVEIMIQRSWISYHNIVTVKNKQENFGI